MAGMFEELYTDPYDDIEQSARSQAALGGWGTIASSAGLAGGMLGRAGSKALGGTYEQDLVEDILLKGDHETPEGQVATLQALSQVSPGAFMKVQKMYDDMNLSKIDLETKQLDLKSKKGETNRHTYWTYNVKPNVARLIAKDHGINASSRTELVNILNSAVNAGKIKSGTRTTTLADFDKRMELEEENWKRTNKYRDFTPGSKGSNVTSAKPDEDKAEKIDASEVVKDKGSDSFVDTYVNKPSIEALDYLGKSGVTLGEYIFTGGLQHDMLGKGISDTVNKYINQPIVNLFK